MKKFQKCPQFGWGCDILHEVCEACKSKDECFKITVDERMKEIKGYKPRIPKAKERNLGVAGISRPSISGDKVRIRMWFDLKWFKKQLGWDFGDKK